MKIIIGAGLSGLIAAHAWPRAEVHEAQAEPAPHRAVLRFRSDVVGRLTGIEFRKVRVHKGLFADGAFHSPNIRWANMYAQKVLGWGRLLGGDRSIWALDTVDRYVAPDTFYEELRDSARGRIHYSSPVDPRSTPAGETVSTAPLDWMAAAVGAWSELPLFHRAPIFVRRWELPNTDLFQTVYFPSWDTSVYRASITGNILIAESMDPILEEDEGALCQAFSIDLDAALPLGEVSQRFGKIEPIGEALRKAMLFELTHRFGIFSLGRFATWRNILLDDVVADIDVIKRLARNRLSEYDLQREANK